MRAGSSLQSMTTSTFSLPVSNLVVASVCYSVPAVISTGVPDYRPIAAPPPQKACDTSLLILLCLYCGHVGDAMACKVT